MGARQDKRPITNKTHLAKIDWISEAVATALVANNFSTLGALKKGLERGLVRGKIMELMKRNLRDLKDLEPLMAKINAAPASERQPHMQT